MESEIWWRCTAPLREEDVDSEEDVPRCNAKEIDREDLKRMCEAIWSRRTQENPYLYNKSKYRLCEVIASTTSSKKLKLVVGLTDYKSFITTNACGDALLFHELCKLGEEKHGDVRAYISDTLGVSACVISSDRYIVLIRRSSVTGELAGFVDTPGGHPEPEDATSRGFIHELFSSIKEEVVAEINIPAVHLSEPLLLGIVRQGHSNGRPGASFLIRCALSSLDILKMYKAGGKESHESSEIIFIPISRATCSNLYSMTPAAKFTLECYASLGRPT